MEAGIMGIIWLIIMTVTICATVFGIVYVRSRENMAMIEKGFDPKIKPLRPRPAPFRNLKWGLLLVGAGLGLFLAYLMDNTVLYNIGHDHNKFGNGADDYNGANVAIYFALIAIGGGMGLITSYRVEKKQLLDKEDKN
jgi:hypothetical protein